MPATVHQHLSERINDLNFMKTAKACDKYFDQSRKLKESSNATAISSVSNFRQPRPQQQQQQPQQQAQLKASFTAPFPAQEDGETNVNAVQF